jgi:hypothetical protein
MGCEHNFPEFQGFISKNPWTVGAIFVKLKGLFAKWWVENMFPESLGVHMKNSCIAGTVFGKFKSFFCKTTDICPIWTVDWADPMARRGPRRGHSPLPPYWPGILVNHLNASNTECCVVISKQQLAERYSIFVVGSFDMLIIWWWNEYRKVDCNS